jgi:polysaccharide pyruvyl transferase WcaK-like protein
MLYGIGAGPFLTEKGKKETKYYIDNFVDEITVRDKESYINLTEVANVNDDKVKLTNDPVAKWNLDKYKKNKVIENTIGVILTPHFDRPIWKDNEVRWPKLFECYTSMINDLITNGKKIKLIFFQDNYENEFSIKLKNSLDDKNIDIIFPTNLNSAIETLSECESIISFRLHGNILAYALNKPFLPIIYHHKTAGFLNNIEYLKKDCILEVGEGLNWKDLPIEKDDWINKSRLFTQYVENKEKFFEK